MKPSIVLLSLLAACCLGSLGTRAESDLPTHAPADAKPLQEDEIRALLGGGKQFEWVGVTLPIAGTGTWNLAAELVYGTFEIGGKISGNWSVAWYVDGDKNCLRYSPTRTVCTYIYAHGDGGFMEVNLDGEVHTVYTPIEKPPLATPLSKADVEDLIAHFLVWNQEADISVGSVTEEQGAYVVHYVKANGSPAGSLTIDRTTGNIRSNIANLRPQGLQ